MLSKIREFFERQIAPAIGEQDVERRLRLATAALLIEVVRADARISDAERDAVLKGISSRFGLSLLEAASLVELAEEQVAQANDYYQFTSLINQHFSAAQKLRVIELMWQVAYADARLSAHEQHVLWRIADLLHVPHGDYIAAKMRARPADG